MYIFMNVAAEFPKTPSPKPALIPPRPLLRAGNQSRQGESIPPDKLFRPAESIFNHLDFARNSFELCPTNTAKIENRNRKPKYGRHFVPTIFLHPNPISFFGGEGGIRTRGTFSSTPPFQGGAFDRSATSPS